MTLPVAGLPRRRVAWPGTGRARRGFTLIEMVVTVAIVLILASAAIPLADIAARRSKEHELRISLRQIRQALDAYKVASEEGRIPKKADESGYPPDLDTLVRGVADQTRADRRVVYFLRSLPRDPFASPELEAARTWATRSYASPPDEPRAGADVFDVASRDEGIGLNGVPYKKW